MKKTLRLANLIIPLVISCQVAIASGGKILATPGVSQIEGAAGGGLVPWAQLAGYATGDEVAIGGFCSHADITDYRLDVCGVQANFYDRVEVSIAQQTLTVPALTTEITQDIVGVKVRLYGDIIYSPWPQVSAGVQSKNLKDNAIATALSASDDAGVDFYVAASKLHLGAALGYHWFWNLALRNTEANQLGLLGFGGNNQGRSTQAELSTAIFINPHFAIGAEYRQKPDNLSVKEDDWKDIFIAWFPTKSFNLTAAYLDLGAIAGAPKQTGWYVSLNGSF